MHRHPDAPRSFAPAPRAGLALVTLTTLAAAAGCKGPMAKIEAERDALVVDDDAKIKDATAGFPDCTEQPPVALKATDLKGPYDDGCFAQIANAFGSKKGFSSHPPDHASAATVGLVLLRDGRGDRVAHANWWFDAMKNGQGIGQDILRLAMAKKMADAAPLVGRTFTLADGAAAKAALKAIAAAIPGACPTYYLVATDTPNVPPEQAPDHSACVYQDLARRDGPGGTYGEGLFRALQGAVSLYREAERTLRMGMGNADAGPKATIEKKLATIEAADKKIVLPEQQFRSNAAMFGMFHEDAGIPMPGTEDAAAPHGPIPIHRGR